MPNPKPKRTNDNLPSRSSPIRKGTMKEEEIKAVAQELTKCPEIIEEVQSPAIEPVAKGDYRAFASSIKAKLTNQETVELTTEFIKSLFPQNKDVSDIVRNLKRGHGINYRRLDNGNYLLFVEPTKEELIVQLTSAESKVIELEKEVTELIREKVNIYQENTQLKSDLNNSQKTNKILFWLAIGAVITIIIKSVAL